MRIATPLFAFGKNADIGHSLQVLGDEGALELVRAFGRFAMTKTDFVYSLKQADRVSVSLLSVQDFSSVLAAVFFRFRFRAEMARASTSTAAAVMPAPR